MIGSLSLLPAAAAADTAEYATIPDPVHGDNFEGGDLSSWESAVP